MRRTSKPRIALRGTQLRLALRELHSAAFWLRALTGWALLLQNLDEIPVHFEHADERLIRLLAARINKRANTAGISTGCDALASLEFAAETVRVAPPGFVPFTIHGEAFEEAGATAVEEVGFTLAAGVDFLTAMEERGVEAGRAAAALEFRFAIGSNYFLQIAKLRAFRMVWARAVESFGATPEAARARIAACTSRWNKTVYDPHVNILRGTTEAMSAALGGADSVTVAPFDACYKQPDEASRRLARNTQLLLKHEAWLGRVADAERRIVLRGGDDRSSGQRGLEATCKRLRRAAASARRRLRERSRRRWSGRWQRERGLLRRAGACWLERINMRIPPSGRWSASTSERMNAGLRGARMYEELRLRTERHAAAGGKTPRVLLAEIGDAKMRAARANFAANFFACAGFEAARKRFRNAAEIAAAEGDLIVLCSADQEYAALAAELMPRLEALGRTTPVIVAGNPEDAEQLKAAGIADFVNMRSNPVEVLTKWQERLGIKG